MCNYRVIAVLISAISALNSCNRHGYLNNKHNGTYTTVNENYADPNAKTSLISVRLYELDNGACKKLSGKIEINGKQYTAIDSTDYVDSDGDKNIFSFFKIDVVPGNYTIKAVVNNKYYPVKTELHNLKASDAITFRFYLIRKNIIKN